MRYVEPVISGFPKESSWWVPTCVHNHTVPRFYTLLACCMWFPTRILGNCRVARQNVYFICKQGLYSTYSMTSFVVAVRPHSGHNWTSPDFILHVWQNFGHSSGGEVQNIYTILLCVGPPVERLLLHTSFYTLNSYIDWFFFPFVLEVFSPLML